MAAAAHVKVVVSPETSGESEESDHLTDATATELSEWAATAAGAEFRYAELKLFNWLHLPEVALRAQLLTRLPYRRLAVATRPGAKLRAEELTALNSQLFHSAELLGACSINYY